MVYRYTESDLLKFPQKYQRTPFEGIEFINNYKNSRRVILEDIKSKIDVGEISDEIRILSLELDKKSEGDNILTKEFLLKCLSQKEKNDEIDNLINKLLKKFEINKKIFSEYDFRKNKQSEDFEDMQNYILFALICTTKFHNTKNLKFLNTLLKLNDIICSRINSITTSSERSLVFHVLSFELSYIEELLKMKIE